MIISTTLPTLTLPTLTLPGIWAFKGGIARNALIGATAPALDLDIVGDQVTEKYLDDTADDLPPIDFELWEEEYWATRDLTINEVLLRPDKTLLCSPAASESFSRKIVACSQANPSGREVWRGRLLALRLGWEFEERWKGVNLPQTMHLMPALLCKAEESGVLLEFLERYLKEQEEGIWRGFPRQFSGLSPEKHPHIWGKVKGDTLPPSPPRWDPEVGAIVTDL